MISAKRRWTGIVVDEGNSNTHKLLSHAVLTYFLETRVSIMRWLSKLDFWRIHEQHVIEREEGTGKISSILEREFSYWLDAANGYVWLRGHRKTLTTI
jgi:hypothetical protein